MTGLFTTFISCFVNASPNKKLIGYSYLEQMRDILPSFLSALGMFFVVLFVGKLPIGLIPLLTIQVLVGVVFYLGISIVFSLAPYKQILNIAFDFLKKCKNKN